MTRRAVRFRLLGVGAMQSPRYAPAGLLLEWAGHSVMFDGGPHAAPARGRQLDAWLVTDLRSELIVQIRQLAHGHGLEPQMTTLTFDGLAVEPHPVVHTSHATCGYLITAGTCTAAWAPEFWQLPGWVAGADLLFADAAGWRRPIRFAGGVGGHAAALQTATEAAELGVKRLVFAHIGRPTIRAIDARESLPFGEFGRVGGVYELTFSDSRPDRSARGGGVS